MTVNERRRSRGLSNPNDFQEEHLLQHPGNYPRERYMKRMTRIRYAMRQYLIQFTDNQSLALFEWQARHRTQFRDVYFAYTALLGSHTFYVLCLPIPAFLGAFDLVRDMVYILGYSIYLSGFFKDYWCLPRPQSPPLHRITLSAYTALEYGAPSSHSANATGVTLLLLWNTWTSPTLSLPVKLGCSFLSLFYYFTLVVGRIYCGMHGMLDITSGAAIGIVCFVVQLLAKSFFSGYDLTTRWWFPICSVGWGLLILLNHVRPIDECPCFEDSVAFIGVVSGVECGDWFLHRFGKVAGADMGLQRGFRFFIYRLCVGIPCIVIWKYVISKPLAYNFLIKVLRFKDDRDEKAAVHAKKNEDVKCPLYIGEAKIDIFGRFIIYAGIPITVVIICPAMFELLNIMSY